MCDSLANYLCQCASVSVRFRILRFPGSTCWRNHYGGKIAFQGQLAEVSQFVALQILPAAEQLCALPLPLLELKLLRFGWSRVSAGDVHCKEGQLGVDLWRVGKRILVCADGQVD